MENSRVLFLCTGNSARSHMAESFLRKYAGDQFEVHSAGLEPKPNNPFTIKVMEEAGFNMSSHRSKGIDNYLGKVHFHYLITVCDEAEKTCPTVWSGVNQRVHWYFEDPAAFEGNEAEKLAKFRQVRDLIATQAKGWLAEQNIPIAA